MKFHLNGTDSYTYLVDERRRQLMREARQHRRGSPRKTTGVQRFSARVDGRAPAGAILPTF